MYNSNCDPLKKEKRIKESILPSLLMFFMLFANTSFSLKSPLRIIGGNDTNQDEYPYIVRLEEQTMENFTNNTIIAKHDHLCTGSALSATWVITAAHCFFGTLSNTAKFVIRYGHLHNSPLVNDSFSDVLYTVGHPLYTITYGEYHNQVMKNDVGLVRTTPMNISRYIKLSATDYLSLYGHEAIIAGYGITRAAVLGDKIQTASTLELKKPLQVLNVLITKCPDNERLAPAFCLAPKCGQKAMVCGGDSGGPLIHPSGLVGVLSLGDNSGDCLDPTEKRHVHVHVSARRCGHPVTACGGDSGGPLIHTSGIAGILTLGEKTANCLDHVAIKSTNVAGIALPISWYIEWICSHVSY
ncbi:unnamed protein product [Parnassius apollo]|uniref:(apollo) hypothetical protein n=1 Tax=Parnassius apollo TaxID=110799 RepID=A0A8S3WRV5_PARAO|nr:unnamed protein product [Parnassius apollo]